MPIASNPHTIEAAFFLPLVSLVEANALVRPCPELTDSDFVHLCVQRVLEESKSGRAFLQEHAPRWEQTPGFSNYFASLRSKRRLALLCQLNEDFRQSLASELPDRLAHIPELEKYECLAADGHWHKAAAHDPRHDGVKMAVGHFYSLDLRRHTLRLLATGEGLHEHDMSALKRVKPTGLRQGVPKGRRVLTIYDRAGIDFDYWKRCRVECAVYFLTRVKEGIAYDLLDERDWDQSDPRNLGVSADQRIRTREGHLLRIIQYTDPVSGESYEFLTNEPDLPPGVLAELYRRRWDLEKVFDEIKNKFGEKKAWGTSLATRGMQAQSVVLAHNLCVRYEALLEEQHGVKNTAEDARRKQRAKEAKKHCQEKGTERTPLATVARKATQHSVKFIRWLRQSVRDRATEALAVLRLKHLYATL